MNNNKIGLLVVIIFTIYFFVGTRFTWHPIWTVDYFNPLAHSLQEMRLDIDSMGDNHDLVHYQNKWYISFGILPALFLLPVQILRGQYIPALYLACLFATLNIVTVYLMLARIKKEYLPAMSDAFIWVTTLFAAFGTQFFYVGTLGSVWHVDQIVSIFFGNLGIYFIFKKKRMAKDYVLSSLAISISLIGRATIVLLGLQTALLFFYDLCIRKKKKLMYVLPIVALPPLIFACIFFAYNYFRFGDVFEYGYNFINEAPYLARLRETHGIFSIMNLPNNVWFMLFELPRFTLSDSIRFHFNLNGNSIFFLSPALFTAFYSLQLIRKGLQNSTAVIVMISWLTALVTIVPSLLVYSPGWMQFGYRYSLDITLLFIVLVTFGMKGKLTWWYGLAVGWSIVMYYLGITSLW